MKKTIIFGIFLITIILYKATTNINYARKLKKYKKLYDKHMCNHGSKEHQNEKQEKEYISFMENKHEIIKLFENAGLKIFSIPITEPTGHGFVQHKNIGLFENIGSPLIVCGTNIPRIINQLFYEGMGIYKNRVKEAFSISYWLNFSIFLPQKIISYIGLPARDEKIKLISKTLNIAYWIFVFTFTVLMPLLHYTFIIKPI